VSVFFCYNDTITGEQIQHFNGGNLMKISIGSKIRELRRRDSRTQEELAAALGVTAQAVSRWESGGSYPDMEIVPSIANFFGVSIDELFGYHGEREAKVNAILAKVEELDLQNMREDATVDECITLLRQGLAEFPGNEKIMYQLAEMLNDAGWKRHEDWRRYEEKYADSEDFGYIKYNFDTEKRNKYWVEAAKLYENLVKNGEDSEIVTGSICGLIGIYRSFGEYEKGRELAMRLPTVHRCREVMLSEAYDGAEQKRLLGQAMLEMTEEFSERFMYALVNDRTNYETEMPTEKVRGLIALFDLLCDDGNLGVHHVQVSYLYLYLARLLWEYGYHDEAFVSLDDALGHAKAFDTFAGQETVTLTAPMVRGASYELRARYTSGYRTLGILAEHLPEDFPMWCNPDYRKVKEEMEADPRWADWVRRCQTKGD